MIIFIANMVLAAFMVYLYRLVYKGAHGESISYVFINAAWHMIEQGVGDIVIAIFYKKSKAVIEN